MAKKGKSSRRGRGQKRDAAEAVVVDHGRSSGAAFDEDDALDEDEVDAFHSSREKVLLGEHFDADAGSMSKGRRLADDDDDEHVMKLDLPSSGDEDDDEEEDEEDGLNPEFVAAYAAMPKRRLQTKDMYGEDKDVDAADLQRSLQGWGKKKQQFYDTNYVDPDFGTDSEEEQLAKAEEEEARLLQQQQAAQMQEADFQLLKPAVPPRRTRTQKARQADEELAEEIPRNLHLLSTTEREQYLRRARPELVALQMLFDRLSTERTQLLLPLLEKLGAAEADDLQELGLPATTLTYLRERMAMVSLYLVAISTYLLLVAQKTPDLENHPAAASLARMQSTLEHVEEAHEALGPRLEAALESLALKKRQPRKRSLQHRTAVAAPPERPPQSKLSPADHDPLASETDDEKPLDASYYDRLLESKEQAKRERLLASLPQDDGRDTTAQGQRMVNYQILKNKGLLPSRKKEYRNPRVRQRNKFAKAQKRRKGQAQDAVREIPRYTGEATGIRRTVTKSTRLG